MVRRGGVYRPHAATAHRGRSLFVRAPRPPTPVNGYSLLLVAPSSGATVRTRRPGITVVPTSVLNDPVDVQVEWRTVKPYINGSHIPVQWLPVPTYATEHLDLISGLQAILYAPADLIYTTWYFRVRVGKKNLDLWGDWTGAGQFINVNPIIGSMARYLDLNVGSPRPPAIGVTAYLDMNIGVRLPMPLGVAATVDFNIGHIPGWRATAAHMDMNVFQETRKNVGAYYADMNVDSSLQPVPHIWWIRPEQGREGYVFHIFGHGFGPFENAYNGVVYLGALVCQVARWALVTPMPLTVTVAVSGTQRPLTSATLLPSVLLSAGTVVMAVGDTIEYDMLWDTPVNSRLDIFPSFTVSGVTGPMGLSTLLLNDTQGRAWVADIPEAYSAWHHRKFVVPPLHTLVGRTISAFNLTWFGFNPLMPVRAASFRSMVVRDSDGNVKHWVTGEDIRTGPLLTYTANTGVLSSAGFTQGVDRIIHGQGLDLDEITVEHGWITVVVPSGAVSAMVKVVLEV